MNIQPSHLIYLAGAVAYVGIRMVFQRRTAAVAKPISRSSAQDRALIAFVITGQLVLPFALVATPWLNWANYSLPQQAQWLGAPLLAYALWVFWRSHADLGESWSVTLELNQNHRLITEGVYRVVRHPMYASFFLMALGQGLLLNNWLAGWAALAAVSLMYVVRVPREERMMLEAFGEEYRSYALRTGGVIPRIQSATDA